MSNANEVRVNEKDIVKLGAGYFTMPAYAGAEKGHVLTNWDRGEGVTEEVYAPDTKKYQNITSYVGVQYLVGMVKDGKAYCRVHSSPFFDKTVMGSFNVGVNLLEVIGKVDVTIPDKPQDEACPWSENWNGGRYATEKNKLTRKGEEK